MHAYHPHTSPIREQVYTSSMVSDISMIANVSSRANYNCTNTSTSTTRKPVYCKVVVGNGSNKKTFRISEDLYKLKEASPYFKSRLEEDSFKATIILDDDADTPEAFEAVLQWARFGTYTTNTKRADSDPTSWHLDVFHMAKKLEIVGLMKTVLYSMAGKLEGFGANSIVETTGELDGGYLDLMCDASEVGEVERSYDFPQYGGYGGESYPLGHDVSTAVRSGGWVYPQHCGCGGAWGRGRGCSSYLLRAGYRDFAVPTGEAASRIGLSVTVHRALQVSEFRAAHI